MPISGDLEVRAPRSAASPARRAAVHDAAACLVSRTGLFPRRVFLLSMALGLADVAELAHPGRVLSDFRLRLVGAVFWLTTSEVLFGSAILALGAAWVGRRSIVRAVRRCRPTRFAVPRAESSPTPRPATRRIAAGLAGPPILRALLLAVWITAFSLRPFIIPGPTMFGPPRPGLAWSAPFPWTNPAIPGLAVGAAWLLVALALLPRLGKGRLVVAWPGRPPATGGTADFHVGTSDGGARLDGVRVLLRCVRESRCGVVRRPEILWVRDAGLDRDAAITPGDDLRVRFDVPARLPATDLQARDAIYWELVVLGRVGPHDYADCVLVPVGAPRTP